MKYKLIDDLTSDVMLEAYGKSLKELLANAAEALFSQVCQIEKIVPSKEITLHVSAGSEKELLHEWLSRLLTESDTEGIFFNKFEVEKIEKDGTSLNLTGKAWGEEASVEKGETLVKAVTYYGFNLTKKENLYTARFSIDI